MNSNQLAFTVPLDGRMIKVAEKLSKQQKKTQKKHEVYLNTLAVLAVNFYCQCMEIETELEKSSGLDSVIISLMNTASLFLKDKGLLECRPILPRDEFCHIPAEVLSERIGYMVVEIDEANREARILGFVESCETEKLPLTRLKPLQDFLVCLRSPVMTKVAASALGGAVSKVGNRLVKLSEWFEGLFGNGWELSVARDVAKDIPPVNATEEEVGAAKIIRLFHVSEPVLLIIRQRRLRQNQLQIILRIYPARDSIFLLDGVKLPLLAD
ncbi:DUF1822 family protein, partial [Aetokthonos hydrillicola]|uniref:DUF1822 family protein n=1 Tax=Aetokthonos hydrillicola TaxID=1550245 RepID=UPI001ABBDADE